MKSLEDYKKFHCVYDRIGKDIKSLVKERQEAQDRITINKRQYSDINRLPESRNTNELLNVAVEPQNAVKKIKTT